MRDTRRPYVICHMLPSVDGRIVRVATYAERQRLIALRENGTIGDAAFPQVEQELDTKELDLL